MLMFIAGFIVGGAFGAVLLALFIGAYMEDDDGV